MTDKGRQLTRVRVLVADPRPVTRAVLTALISSHIEFEACAEAADGEEAVEKSGQLSPDIVVLDVDLPTLNGLQAARRIIQSHPLQKIILLVASDEASVVRAIFECGAHGFLLKASATHDLVSAIEAVNHGRSFYSAKAADLLLREYLKAGTPDEVDATVSGRQREILTLLAKEFSSSFAQANHRKPRGHPRFKFIALFVIVAVGALLYIHTQDPASIPSFIDRSLLRVGLKKAPAQIYDGNPDAKVWIDERTALYYCPGDPHYAQHRKGRFATQIDAQSDHFVSATRKLCK